MVWPQEETTIGRYPSTCTCTGGGGEGRGEEDEEKKEKEDRRQGNELDRIRTPRRVLRPE